MESEELLRGIARDTERVLEELTERIEFQPGRILVVGGSSSEVLGANIGSAGSLAVAERVLGIVQDFAEKKGLYLAVQCCEHLNRALVVEEELAVRTGLEVVSVVPVQKAGGAFATVAYKSFVQPVLVESILADYGMDIGNTFIGMHLKRVAVPVRVPQRQIGSAVVNIAKTRPKLIGGIRAVYENI